MRYSVVTDLCTNEAVRLQSFTILTPMRPQTNIKTVLPIKAYLRKWEAMLERVKVKQNNAYCVLRGFTRWNVRLHHKISKPYFGIMLGARLTPFCLTWRRHVGGTLQQHNVVNIGLRLRV